MINYETFEENVRNAMKEFLRAHKGPDVTTKRLDSGVVLRTEKAGKHSFYGRLKQSRQLETVWAFDTSTGTERKLARITETEDKDYEFEVFGLQDFFLRQR